MKNHCIKIKTPEVDVGWVHPQQPWLKVNVDGAVFERQRAAGVGVVIRDHLGLGRAALSMKIHAPLGSLEIEAKAIEEGMRFAWDHGFSSAIFEGDSMVVHNSLTSSITSPASICNLISGSLYQATQFRECSFSVVPRCGNKVAHGLAQHAKSLFESVIWLKSCPPFVEHLVISDVMFSFS